MNVLIIYSTFLCTSLLTQCNKEDSVTHKVSVILPILIREDWQEVMTEACIKTMKCTTNIPYELIIVESGRDTFKRMSDKHIMIEEKSTYTKDFNKGADIASG